MERNVICPENRLTRKIIQLASCEKSAWSTEVWKKTGVIMRGKKRWGSLRKFLPKQFYFQDVLEMRTKLIFSFIFGIFILLSCLCCGTNGEIKQGGRRNGRYFANIFRIILKGRTNTTSRNNEIPIRFMSAIGWTPHSFRRTIPVRRQLNIIRKV